MNDANGNPIEVRGDLIIVRVPVRNSCKAVRYTRGKIETLTESYFEAAKKEGSWMRQNDPGVQFGTDYVQGEVSVAVDLKELRHLAFVAARNQSKKSTSGPARAAFSGIRTFTKESA